MHLLSQNGVIMEMYAEEELNERVNGGDSDDDGDDARDFKNIMRDVKLERSRVVLVDDGIEKAD